MRFFSLFSDAVDRSTIATLYWNKDEESKSYFFWGLMIGSCASAFAMWLYLLYLQVKSQSGSKYETDMAAKKEALRRKEQEVFERHDEFVYYDAAQQQSQCYRFLCCPDYGKITSERILYSEQVPVPGWEVGFCCGCSFKYVVSMLAWPWAKRVQSVDIDGVSDVGVEQSCMGYVTNTGTVVINVLSHSDTSAIEAQREKLRMAMAEQDLQKLREALDAAGGVDIPELREDTQKARQMADELAATAGAQPYVYVAAKGNTMSKVHVLSVVRPYAVMDDISYKITKNQGGSWRK